MPIQIDHLDTTVEIQGREQAPGLGSAPARAAAPPTPPARDQGRALLEAFAAELDRYARMRGL